MKTGFIGLGHLGKAIAQRLISEGTDMVVWNRTKGKAADLGVEIADSPAQLTSKADVIFVNLFDSNAVRSVLTADNGLLKGDCKGKVIVDTTTNHYDEVIDFHEMMKAQGATYLESPVLGSIVPASQGALTVLVSGEKSAFDRVHPLLQKIGRNIFHLDKPTLATKMKLINNLCLGSFMATIAEALAFGEEAGIARDKVLEVLGAGAGNSGVLNAKKEKLLKEDFSAHFKASLMYKDLHYLHDLAWALKRPLFTGSIAKELFGMTFSKNMEEQDFAVVYKVLKKL
ncbi:MAG: NAD(P)-dependent oxidoreductase [Nitrospirota bacterium]